MLCDALRSTKVRSDVALRAFGLPACSLRTTNGLACSFFLPVFEPLLFIYALFASQQQLLLCG